MSITLSDQGTTLVGPILEGAYALVRHWHIPAPGHVVLLTLGLIGVAGLWLVVPLYSWS